MKKAVLLALAGFTLSIAAQADVASVADSRPMILVPQNSRIYFSKPVTLKAGSEALSIVNDGGLCKLRYDKMPTDVALTNSTPITILDENEGYFLYGDVVEQPLTINITLDCMQDTTIGELQSELNYIGAQLTLSQ